MVTRRATRRILGDFKEKVLSERNVQRMNLLRCEDFFVFVFKVFTMYLVGKLTWQ